MIIYKSEPLNEICLENLNYFKHQAICKILAYNINQGIFKFELKELSDDEKAFELDRYMVGSEIYFYNGIQKDYSGIRDIINNLRYLILKVEPKQSEDIEEINGKLYLTENISMIKVEPINNYKGERL